MTWKLGSVTIVGFKLKDPRVFMSCVLIVYTIVGEAILSFDHGFGQILLSLGVACALDILLNFWKTRQLIFPLSGVITGLGLGLLIESTAPSILWPYVAGPVLAIASKSLIRIRKKHIFNPSNFGLVVLLLLFPAAVTTTAAQWTGSLLIVGIVFAVGCFSSYRVSRLDLVLSFIGGFCLMALLQERITHTGFAVVYGPLIGTGLQLFILSMITDPKTTPDKRSERIIFGLAIAVIDGLLRLANNQYSPFIALLVVSACFPVYQAIAEFIQGRKQVAGGESPLTTQPQEATQAVEATQTAHS